MSLTFYNILHVIGGLLLILGFLIQLSAKSIKKGMMLHGIGLVILLVSGFGQLAKLGIFGHMPTWAIVKLVLWLVLGGIPVLAKRKVVSRPVMVGIALVIAGFAAYLGCCFYLGRPLPF